MLHLHFLFATHLFLSTVMDDTDFNPFPTHHKCNPTQVFKCISSTIFYSILLSHNLEKNPKNHFTNIPPMLEIIYYSIIWIFMHMRCRWIDRWERDFDSVFSTIFYPILLCHNLESWYRYLYKCYIVCSILSHLNTLGKYPENLENNIFSKHKV